jgi:cyclohexadieny/prephenate dehydrogenase
MAAVLSGVVSALSPGCVITDVGSVKGAVVETLPGLLPAGVEFVGSHPMAGSHLRGPDHARADLF